MNWIAFFSAAAGVIAGVAVCGALFWFVFYGSGESDTSAPDVTNDVTR